MVLRVFRRRRRPHAALAHLLSGVTESCQSWLDQKIFRGVFRAEEDQNQNWDAQLNESTCSERDDLELHKGHGFTYGQSEQPGSRR